MKRTLLLSIAALLLVLAPPAFAFGQKDVVKMTAQGISDDVIIAKIENSSHIFDLDTDEIAALRDQGVSDRVINAMIQTESRYQSYDYGTAYTYPYYTYYPYTSSFYRPYYYPRSSFSLGLGFSTGGRHDPYYRRYNTTTYPYTWRHR